MISGVAEGPAGAPGPGFPTYWSSVLRSPTGETTTVRIVAVNLSIKIQAYSIEKTTFVLELVFSVRERPAIHKRMVLVTVHGCSVASGVTSSV